MNIQNKKKIFLAAALFLLILIAPALVTAGDTNKITISPSVISLNAKREETTSGSFIYTNGTTREQNLSFSISSFNSSGVSGSQPIFYTSDGKEVVSPSTDWIKIDSAEQVIAAGQKKEIFFSITIPKDAELGKYQNAIFVNSSSSNNGDQSSVSGNLINYRIGILTFLDVEKNEKKVPDYHSWYLSVLIIIALFVLVLWYNRKGTRKMVTRLIGKRLRRKRI